VATSQGISAVLYRILLIVVLGDGTVPFLISGGSDMLLILGVVMLLVILGGLAKWPQSRGWASYPKEGMGLAVVLVLTLLLLRHP